MVPFSKCQELDKTSSEINRHKVKITSGEKLVKKLAKTIEDSKIDTEKLLAEKEKMMSIFKEIEKKAFVVQEEYRKTQEVFVQLYCTLGWALRMFALSDHNFFYFFHLLDDRQP